MTPIYVRITSEPVDHTTEVLADWVMADWDSKGDLVGIEILVDATRIEVDGEHVWRIGDS